MQFVKRTALAAVILLLLAGCSLGASAQSGGLVISEVVTSNSNSLIDPVIGKPDWIELCNTGSAPISLLDYSISESSTSKFDFPDVTLGPGEYIILYCCQELKGVTAENYCTNFKLSKGGATLTLTRNNGLVQRLDIPALETDISYGVRSDGKYAYFAQATPGAPNSDESYDDLESLESDKTVKLTLTEVLPKPAGDAPSWAEIYNAGDTAVKLSDYYVTEDLSDPTKARLPEITLGAGEYAVVKFTGSSGADEVPFKIGSDETMLAVSNNFGSVIDTASWDASVLPGISAGRDDKNAAIYYIEPTPGTPNGEGIASAALTEGLGDVRINEILLDNTFSIIDEDGERSEWAELYNAGSSTVSLSGCALSDRADDPLKWRLPSIDLAPGSYITVFLSGKDRTSEAELHANFRLGSGDDKLCLTSLKEGVIQTVALPSERKNNISYGLSSDGQWLFFPQPTPGAANDTKGFAEIAMIDSEPDGLRINEVASVSAAKSGKKDWIELRNGLSSDLSLSGYYLSDTKDDLKKWPLASTTIKAGGYKVIDGFKGDDKSGELDIKPSGETLYLTSPEGSLIDEFRTGVLRPGLSCGLDSGNAAAIFDKPTPGAKNDAGVLQGYCGAPFFSVSGGYQTDSVSIEMTTSTPEAQIFYTLDGSTPTTNSKEYTGPVTVSDTKSVRAIATAPGMLKSDETVATYLFESRHKLPVVCLSMTQKDLNYVFGSKERDDKRERAGYVEYYEPDGSLGVRFPAGFRIAGAGTRTYKQKSINLYLRGGYGRSSVTYPFFEGYDITTFKSLSLRNMGGWQDSATRIKDAYISMAVNGMNVDNMQTRFAAVYINGKYWGLYEFKENLNEDYYAEKYGVDPDDVVMIRGNTNPVDKGSRKDIKEMYALAQKTSNDKKFDEYVSRADSDYFMDYIIAETFFYCYDSYNQKFAHTTDNIVKWRPMYYDFDLCFSSASVNNIGFFFRDKYVRGLALYSGQPDRVTDLSLYNGFYKNPEWREKYVKRFAEVLNTVLTTDKLLELYDGMVDSMRDEMPRTIKRWGGVSSMKKWESNIASLRNRIESRRKYVIKYLKSFFKLSEAEMTELFPND